MSHPGMSSEDRFCVNRKVGQTSELVEVGWAEDQGSLSLSTSENYVDIHSTKI